MEVMAGVRGLDDRSRQELGRRSFRTAVFAYTLPDLFPGNRLLEERFRSHGGVGPGLPYLWRCPIRIRCCPGHLDCVDLPGGPHGPSLLHPAGEGRIPVIHTAPSIPGAVRYHDSDTNNGRSCTFSCAFRICSG